MTRIEWTNRARKQLAKINQGMIPKIVQAVAELANWPDCRNVKALQSREGYRLRIGRYRVVFVVHDGETRIVLIEEVKKRDERTYQ